MATEVLPNLRSIIDFAEDVCADQILKPKHHNQLKRPFEEEDSEEEYDNEIDSSLRIILLDESTKRMASQFINNPDLARPFKGILECLQKQDITSEDAKLFSEFVKEVLETTSFIKAFYNESSSSIWTSSTLLCDVRTFGIITQNRVNYFGGKNEKLMRLIKQDSCFPKAFKGGYTEFDLRGLLSVLLAYCITEEDLEKMSRKIGYVAPEVWVGIATPPNIFKQWGLEIDNLDEYTNGKI